MVEVGEREVVDLGLRRSAELRLASSRPDSRGHRPDDRLVHELQVHEIELEMQNEALRQAQHALEESRNRYLDLFDFAPVGYLTLTPKGLIEEANVTLSTLLGVDRRELLQRPFSALVSGADTERWLQHWRRIEHCDGNVGLELGLRRPDGGIADVMLNFIILKESDNIKGIRIALTDISVRKRLEREKEHSRRRIDSLMRHASDCIVVLDANNCIMEVSDSCLDTYGYSRAEFLAMRGGDLRAPGCRSQIPELLKQLAEQGALSYETWHCHKDGSRFPIQVGATMIEVDGRRYFQMIVRDMSKSMRQRVEMENALAAASRRLCELSRHLVETQEDVRRRLSGELHDLTSSNLAAININMCLISDAVAQAASPEMVGRLADTLALIEDTDVSIRTICADLRSPVIDYAGLAASMQAYADQYAKRSGIAVKVDCLNASIRLLPALESLLFRIFQEALTNSLKHAKATLIQVMLDLNARPIILTISDDGVGFDMAAVEKRGTGGMGLRNMQEMAELAGGELSIRSTPGAGTQLIARIQA